MGVPFRIGLMQLTMEPLEEMLETARELDRGGFDTIWLAEAYPWWRKHGMEARSSTVLSGMMARETERLTIAWGIISPYTRHPVQVAMDARLVQEAAGPERFIVGFGTSKIFLNNTKQGGPPTETKPLAHMRDSVAIVRGALSGARFEYDGKAFSADLPAIRPEASVPGWEVPVYVAATAPLMQALGGEIGDGLLTPSITTPAFVRYTRGNVARGATKAGRDPAGVDVGCTIVASIHATDRDAGRDGAREIAGMYLANKFQNIKGSADTLLELAEIGMDELAPVAAAMESGGRLAAKAQVTDSLLDRCKPIAGTPEDCIAAIEAYREAGCSHIMLELWGEHRHEQIRLFGERVLPPLSMTEVQVNEERLVEWASQAIGTPSFTGSEQAMAELMAATLAELGAQVQWQQVEEGRANVLGTWPGAGGGASLMFNGHLDTSYSGREPWLAGVAGFQPKAFVKDGRLFGLGISNMKGALACYVEAVRALRDAGVPLKGDLMVAAVCGEIEKAQWGDAQGAEYRGYAAGSRYLVTHGGVADMCILGEPTESKVVLGHFGSLWLRISTRGNFIHTAFSEGKRDQNSILRMREVLDAVLEWVPSWERDAGNAYRGVPAIVSVSAIQGGFGWRVSRTPHRTDLFLDVRVPPTKPMATARGEVLAMVRRLAERFPDYGVEGEVYVTAPGAEIDEGHPLIAALDASHEEVFGAPPERDVTRWFSDASALTRAGVATVNYGTSTGLLDTTDGENLEIAALAQTAHVYALVAMRVCGVA